MKYLLLIYGPQTSDAAPDEAMNREYGQFTQEILESGEMLAGDALQAVDTATSVRVRDGKRSTTDGPFAETKEQLGGYYLLEAADLNDALNVAARIPGARTGSIEVRPIMVFSNQPS
jgi:hypothetical protein